MKPMHVGRRRGAMRSMFAVLMLLVACTPGDNTTTSGEAHGTLDVQVVAGPVCPVVQDPPEPECEPRPVEGARIFVQPGDGRDIIVAEATTDAEGTAVIELPPGDYILAGAEVESLMGRPDTVIVIVTAGQTTTVTLVYDTGIR